MKKALDDAALDLLFREARSCNRWAAESVSDETLHQLYELLKFGPTSLNTTPARFLFVKSAEAKAKLVACVSPGNLVKVEQAPVTDESWPAQECLKDSATDRAFRLVHA